MENIVPICKLCRSGRIPLAHPYRTFPTKCAALRRSMVRPSLVLSSSPRASMGSRLHMIQLISDRTWALRLARDRCFSKLPVGIVDERLLVNGCGRLSQIQSESAINWLSNTPALGRFLADPTLPANHRRSAVKRWHAPSRQRPLTFYTNHANIF